MALLISFSPPALGYSVDYNGHRTYFRGIYVSGGVGQGVYAFDMIRVDPSDPNVNYSDSGVNNSSTGYVIPNRQSTTAGPGNTSGGAIGTTALGINGTNDPNRKQKLFNLLQKLNQKGSAWDIMGSALVVHLMLQKPPSNSGWGDAARTITPEEWTDLNNRLVKNDSLTMEYDPSYSVNGITNTTGVRFQDSNGNNVLDAISGKNSPDPGDSGFAPTWVFKVNGTTVLVLEVNCANPVGDFPGLPAAPPKKYNLSPSATLDKSVVEPDDSATVTNTVDDPGAINSDQTDWRLTQMIFKPGTTLAVADTQGRDSANDPCSAFTNSGRTSCTTVQESKNQVFTQASTTYNPNLTYNVAPNTPVGTKICFTASVSRPTQDPTPVWRHSILTCITVGKKPKMQVWGGDVRVGDMIDTSTSTFNSQGKTYGSWGEYAALSNQSNSGFASGAGLNKGNTNSTQTGWSSLTFANTGSGSCTFGCYGFSTYAPSLTGEFTSSGSSPALGGNQNLSGLGSGTYRAGNVTITGGTIGTGKSIVIVATGTVTITGNISYSDGPYTSVADIPQAIISAPAINIAGSVGNVDAWLIASTPNGAGAVNTCSDVATNAQLTASICSNALRINGPVVTDKLYLRRTAGSGGVAGANDPAETFDLRADALLWGSGYGDSGGKIQTVYSKELPPRF